MNYKKLCFSVFAVSLWFFNQYSVLAQRTIVAFGDSNGASEKGWVNQLRSIRPQDSIFNYSISGNTIGFDNLGNKKLNTLEYINAYLEDAARRTTTGKLDDIVVLLGTNDCKKVFEGQSEEVIDNLGILIKLIQEQNLIKLSESVVYIVTPPPIGEDSILIEKYKGGDQRLRELLPGFMDQALNNNCQFVDIYSEMKPEFTELNLDGIHLNSKGSTMVASIISQRLDQNSKILWDDETKVVWPSQVKVVDITSHLDGEIQKAYYYKSTKSSSQPLIISLHTWSGDYTQRDPLIEQILENDWNYIHPDFRGVNNTPKSCGSTYAIDDIEQAITFAMQNSKVDKQNIHVIGASGGGYATLYTFMNSDYPINSFSAWVPISDIESWYYQSLGRKNKYAGHILAATSSVDSVLNVAEAQRRSPIYMETPVKNRSNSSLKIYAGIHDGYTGSVPISQSLNFYNKVIKDFGADEHELITESTILELVTMQTYPNHGNGKIGNRQIIFEKKYENCSIVIFDGTHEMLDDVALKLLPINNEN